MCGFVGFLDEAITYSPEEVVRAMADRIIHRGPDSDGYFCENQVGMGFRRLSIIDLAGGDQPIFNEDKNLVITFNGEIYNFQELREELLKKGHVFTTRTDTEVLLHGYEEWGEALPGKLRGMFAFVIYDRKEQSLFGARDIFGIKPFYYYRDGGTFLYGSEVKGFLPHPNFRRTFNEQWLPTYLCFEYLPCDETLFENVHKLPAGCWFKLKNGEMRLERYFDLRYDIRSGKTMEQWMDEIEETFRASCKAHCISDVEVGCFLSSGVDSSFVTRLLSEDMPVRAFSVGYAEKKYSELPHAVELAEKIGVECITREITAEQFFDAVPAVQYHMDEPLPNPSAVPLYYLTQMAGKEVKVVLSGEGADELFGGYNYYKECLDFEKYMKVPAPIRRLAGNVAEKLPAFHGRRFLMRGRYPLEKRYIRNNYNYHYTELGEILKDTAHVVAPDTLTKPIFDRVAGQDEVTRMQYADICTWLQYDILQKADKMSMAASLELRVPFLDREVLKLAVQIPSEYRVTKDVTKIALRRTAERVLPKKSAMMPKIGFITPLNDWMRQDEYYGRIRAAFESDTADRFFKRDALLAMLEKHRAGHNGDMKKIWSVYCFLVWYDTFFGDMAA
ncbi:MAG: asparagine synthase (glutamine-hydrolyzing) [Oscillospiraceae bacterium]